MSLRIEDNTILYNDIVVLCGIIVIVLTCVILNGKFGILRFNGGRWVVYLAKIDGRWRDFRYLGL